MKLNWVSKWSCIFLISFTAALLGSESFLLAQDDAAKKEEAAPAAKEEPAAAPAAAPLPAYFTGTNEAGKPASWPDPTGGKAGYWVTPAAGPVGDGDPAGKSPVDLYDRIAHNMFSINMVWTLITGFLVMFMQAGFMLVEVGLTRGKNASHTSGMNLMIYPLGCIGFWVYGFALGWGNWFNGPVPPGWYASLGPGLSVLNSGIGLEPGLDPVTKEPNGTYKYGLMGTKGFFLEGVDDVSVMALFFFMMVFMDTTATIPTGALAERWAWKNFCLYGFWVALPYCLYANWVWGGGWLAQSGINWGWGHGAVDFAGSGVVHAMGGIISLAGVICLGPRAGKYVNGKPVPMPAHHVPMVVAGTFILAFGWFGFNPGSTLSGTDLRIAMIVVNTMLAGVVACLFSMFTLWAHGLKSDTTMICNGMLAGLVAITAPCAFVDSKGAAIIGAIAGILVVLSVFFWEKVGIDDPVGAISVHGVNGIWGVISVGLFANGKYGLGWNGVNRAAHGDTAESMATGSLNDGVRGLFYGDSTQLPAQLASAATIIVFGFIMAFVWFKISNLITPIRVSAETELAGLDGPEMGVLGYPEFTTNRG